MRFRIHRGAKEIGGNLVEIESRGKRIFLDVGMPLSLPEEGRFSSDEIRSRTWQELVEHGYLPRIRELYEGEAGDILGIVLSHPHQDHFGFANFIQKNIPFFISEKGKILIDVTSKFTRMNVKLENCTFYKDREVLRLGPFEITPYKVDHSAFESYGFLVTADGKSLYYSGDFRAHGRQYWLFPKLLKDLSRKKIDVLLMEGTMIGRPAKRVKEEDLEDEMRAVISKTEGLVLFQASSQNVDRIVTVFKAAASSGRELVMDGYTAYLYRVLGEKSLPNADFAKVQVYGNITYTSKVKREKTFDDMTNPFRGKRVFSRDFVANPGKYVMCFRDSMIRDFSDESEKHVPLKALKGASYIYSLWKGYWKKMDAMQAFLKKHGINGPFDIHCSGHAYVEDLQKLAKVAAAKKLIPIHTAKRERYEDYFDNVLVVDDGRWVEVE